MSWLGLALLVTGLVVGIYPLLPATPSTGAMLGVPHAPAWVSFSMTAAGIGILLWARFRASS